jgi:hypothetical protein
MKNDNVLYTQNDNIQDFQNENIPGLQNDNIDIMKNDNIQEFQMITPSTSNIILSVRCIPGPE